MVKARLDTFLCELENVSQKSAETRRRFDQRLEKIDEKISQLKEQRRLVVQEYRLAMKKIRDKAD